MTVPSAATEDNVRPSGPNATATTSSVWSVNGIRTYATAPGR
ncbi:hypothetical protein [Microtetraspora malaysiensis]|nr:hypothetical protein [Microtetraspora malaysiensis]